MRMFTLAACGVLVLAAAAAAPAPAQTGAIVNVYTVNFVCGYQASATGTEGYEPLVKVANYATKIDLSNFTDVNVLVAGRVYDTTNSPWPTAVPGSPLPPANLPLRTASVIDCNTIVSTFGGLLPGKPFYSGMVTIRSGEPLAVWATKTTQICAGTAQLVNQPPPPPIWRYQPFYFAPDPFGGQPTITLYAPTSGAPPVTVDWSTYGCPTAEVDQGGYVVFQGPAGEVPPNSRIPYGILPVGPMYGLPGTGQNTTTPTNSTLSISHSMDFERVEAEQLELPEGVQPPGCV